MDFGQALWNLKNGNKVAREGWNGKRMFIYMVRGQDIVFGNLRKEANEHVAEGKNPQDWTRIQPHIDMKAADGTIVVGWLASQTDMLAEDWIVVT